MDVDGLSFECINRAGVPAENALNFYIDAYNIWNDCVGDYGCTLDSIESKLQRKWSKASKAVERATNALDL